MSEVTVPEWKGKGKEIGVSNMSGKIANITGELKG